MSVDVGSTAPDFTLAEPGPPAGDAQRARGAVRSCWRSFPAAFSSVCTKELCTFRDSMARLNKAQRPGVRHQRGYVLRAEGVSRQQKLTFPLLSDFNKQVIRDYGVFNEDMIGLKGIAKRAVFVLDKDGVVRHREVLEDARNEPDYEQGRLAALLG